MSGEADAVARLLALSRTMASAAETQDWDRLTETGEAYLSLFASARDALARTTPETLKELIANEDRAREHAAPWLDAARPLLDVLSDADGAHGDP